MKIFSSINLGIPSDVGVYSKNYVDLHSASGHFYSNLVPLAEDTVSFNNYINNDFVDEKEKLKSYALVFSKKIKESKNNNFKNVELLKDFSTKEIAKINDFMENAGLVNIFMFASGNKPAVLSASKNVDVIQKFQSDKVDVLQFFNAKNKSYDVFLLNKNAVKNIIKENKELFSKRMNLDENSNIEQIYEKLLQKDSPLNNENMKDDLLGLILGYPKINTSIFNLEKQFDSTGNFRRHAGGDTYKEYLERFLFGNDSPYKDMSIGFKENLACKINQIKEIKHSRKVLFGEFNKLYDAGYDFIYFVEEPEELNRIKSNFVNVVQNLSNEKLISIK